MHARSALLGRAKADGRRDLDERGPKEVRLCTFDGDAQGLERAITVVDGENLPTIRLVALAHVLSEGEGRAAIDLDLVVIVQHDESPQPQVASEGACL
eukprot:scaffold279618_cov28-Tisochrysis_lutea.AAC.3